MLDDLSAIPTRIQVLKRRLAARDGKKEYKDNVPMIRAEIARLESATIRAKDADWDLASGEDSDNADNTKGA